MLNSQWNRFKIHARWILSTRINRLKLSSKLIIQLSLDKLQELEITYNTHPTSENLNKVKLQAHTVTQLYTEKAKQHIFFCKQRVYEQGEKAGKLFAYLAHLDNRPPVVVSLTEPDGINVTDPSQVAAKFKQFYSNLYKSQCIYAQRDIQNYLHTIQFPV